ncbi:MAG TPA: helix-turn-helix transcriptional regulator, partial [Thermomicrobiales bacterium]|nr:helix-turn-helix transcriptional regulator [Thermomicrobiales bacterium]
MVDIARRAGVSVSTVSYVLSGKRTISDATRQRVLAVMTEAGYAPNAIGQALAERRSRTIALLFPALGRGLSEMDLDFVTNAAAVAG